MTPEPEAPRPTVIFLPRTAPRDGESTVMRIENELVDLLRDRLNIVSELQAMGTFAPLAATMDAGGVIGGESLTVEGLRAGNSLQSVLNHFFAVLRPQLDLELISSAGVFCYAWIGDTDSRFTERADEANALIAWLLHKTQIVEVNIPYTKDPPPGESPYGSPTGENIKTLPFISGQHVKWTSHAPPGGSTGVWGCGVGDHALTIHHGGLVERWDLAEGLPIDAFSLPSSDLSVCAVAGRGEWYLTGSSDGKVALWHADRHEETIGPSEPDAVTACALDGSGNRALVAFANGALLFWDLLQGKACWSSNAADVCALSGDGTRAITSSPSGPPVFWEIIESEEPEILYALRAEQGEVTRMMALRCCGTRSRGTSYRGLISTGITAPSRLRRTESPPYWGRAMERSPSSSSSPHDPSAGYYEP